MGADEGRERLLGAEDRAGEIGLVNRLVLDRDAEDGMGVWDAVEGYVVLNGGVEEEEGERVGLALGRGKGGGR